MNPIKLELPILSPSSSIFGCFANIVPTVDAELIADNLTGAVKLNITHDSGIADALSNAQHREPEAHVIELVEQFVLEMESQGADLEDLQVIGLSSKDISAIEACLNRLSRDEAPFVLFPDDITIKCQQKISEYTVDEPHLTSHVVFARHILEHARDPESFLRTVSHLVGRHGFVIFEVPDAGDLIDHFDITQLWEEHSLYFTKESLLYCLKKNGFEVILQQCLFSDGESLICVLARNQFSSHNKNYVPNVDLHKKYGLFFELLPVTLNNIRRNLNIIRSADWKIFLFGANHMCGTFLDLIEADTDLIDRIIDDDIEKQGSYMTQKRIKIEDRSYLIKSGDSKVIILMAISAHRAPGLYEELARYLDNHIIRSKVCSLQDFCKVRFLNDILYENF